MASMNLIIISWLTAVSTVLLMLVAGFFYRIYGLNQLLLNFIRCAMYVTILKSNQMTSFEVSVGTRNL